MRYMYVGAAGEQGRAQGGVCSGLDEENQEVVETESNTSKLCEIGTKINNTSPTNLISTLILKLCTM